MTNTDLLACLPLLILTGAGFLTLLWDAFKKSPSRASLWIVVLGSLGAISAAAGNLFAPATVAFNGLFFSNSYTNFFTIVFSAAALLSALLADRYLTNREVIVGEYSALILFATAGMVMLGSGANLIVTFLGLETMSISFYVLAGLFRTEESSNEASLKYFLLGAFATGFFLYGIALVYGCTGSMSLVQIRDVMTGVAAKPLATYNSTLLLLGMLMLIVGLSFKVAAFPFHQWAPDVYEGSPTVISGFMSTAGKAAAFAAFILLFNYALLPKIDPNSGAIKIQMVLGIIAALSMLYGNIVAIAQTKIKRMLAYSSVAHAGYLMMGVASLNNDGVTGIAVYSAVYVLMQIGAFGIVSLLEKEGKGLDLEDYAGLAKQHPWTALLLSVLMLSLAGIPPFAGFFGKYYLFLAAIHSGMTWLAIVGVVSSIIASYFYLRLIVLMYFRDSKELTPTTAPSTATISYVAVGLAVIALVIFGLQPGLLLSAAGYLF